jgi:hypothetical protein
MTVSATVQASIDATKTSQSGLSAGTESRRMSFSVDVGDCDLAWSERRSCQAYGYDDVNLEASGVSVVKLLCVKNLSPSATIAMTAGWNGTDFRTFMADTLAWNFAPMVNLGSLTLRGYPIKPLGSFLLSCPNSTGFATTSGGSVLRIGGPSGTAYEIYVLGN